MKSHDRIFVSVIVPTYNESGNVKKLILSLYDNLKKLDEIFFGFEIIIVDDDSPDLTWKIAQDLKKYNVKVIRRIGIRGLGSAVIQGFKISKGDILGVIDADLSHPPALIRYLITKCVDNDIVIASRYIPKISNKNFGLSNFRKIVSYIATLFARPLTNVKDPMSGYFFIKRKVVKTVSLDPVGYKILLEILVKGRYDRESVIEVPFAFGVRYKGKSKLNLKVYTDYIKHLYKLYLYKLK